MAHRDSSGLSPMQRIIGTIALPLYLAYFLARSAASTAWEHLRGGRDRGTPDAGAPGTDGGPGARVTGHDAGSGGHHQELMGRAAARTGLALPHAPAGSRSPRVLE